MNIESDRKIIRMMSMEKLQESLCQLEFDRVQAIHYVDDKKLEYVVLLIDAVCGEIIRREKSIRNDKEPKWTGPKCPETYYELMSLGTGELA